MPEHKQGKKGRKHGRNKLKCARYAAEGRLEKSRERRRLRSERFVAESRERRAAHGPYPGEKRRTARYGEYLRRKALVAAA